MDIHFINFLEIRFLCAALSSTRTHCVYQAGLELRGLLVVPGNKKIFLKIIQNSNYYFCMQFIQELL